MLMSVEEGSWIVSDMVNTNSQLNRRAFLRLGFLAWLSAWSLAGLLETWCVSSESWYDGVYAAASFPHLENAELKPFFADINQRIAAEVKEYIKKQAQTAWADGYDLSETDLRIGLAIKYLKQSPYAGLLKQAIEDVKSVYTFNLNKDVPFGMAEDPQMGERSNEEWLQLLAFSNGFYFDCYEHTPFCELWEFTDENTKDAAYTSVKKSLQKIWRSVREMPKHPPHVHKIPWEPAIWNLWVTKFGHVVIYPDAIRKGTQHLTWLYDAQAQQALMRSVIANEYIHAFMFGPFEKNVPLFKKLNMAGVQEFATGQGIRQTQISRTILVLQAFEFMSNYGSLSLDPRMSFAQFMWDLTFGGGSMHDEREQYALSYQITQAAIEKYRNHLVETIRAQGEDAQAASKKLRQYADAREEINQIRAAHSDDEDICKEKTYAAYNRFTKNMVDEDIAIVVEFFRAVAEEILYQLRRNLNTGGEMTKWGMK